MCPFSITFSTVTGPSISWIDGLERLKKADLQALRMECRIALCSLEAQLGDQERAKVDICLEEWYQTLKETALGINQLGKLRPKDTKLLKEADEDLQALRTDRDTSTLTGREFRAVQYLRLFLRVLGPAQVLLLVCSLGKTRLHRLSSTQETRLISHVRQHRNSLSCPALAMEAKRINLGQTSADISSPFDKASGKRKRDGSTTIQSSSFSLNSHSLRDTTMPSHKGDCDTVEPQGLLLALHQPSTSSHDISQDHNQIRAREATATPSRKLSVEEFGGHGNSGGILIGAPETPTYVSPYGSTVALSPRQPFAEYLHLDDTKELATILAFLGEADVSERMLLRASQPQRFWSPVGEIQERPALSLIPVLADVTRFRLAIQRLEYLGLITTKVGSSYRRFSIDSSLRLQIQGHSPLVSMWKLRAAKLVFHTFPGDPILDPFYYAEDGKVQLSHFQIALTNFNSPNFCKSFSSDELVQVIEGCLSASRFSDSTWKRNVLAVGENILKNGPLDSPLLARLVRVRRQVVSSLYPSGFGEGFHNADLTTKREFIMTDARSNACLGEEMLANVQQMIERDMLENAWSELERIKPLNEHRPSTLEQSMMQQVTLFKGKVCRYEGRFLEAKACLESLLYSNLLYSGILCSVITQIVAVYCELDDVQNGMRLAAAELKILQDKGTLESNMGRRLRLALAETYLMEGLWMIRKDNRRLEATHQTSRTDRRFRLSRDQRVSLTTAKEIYHDLQKDYQKISELSKVGRFSCFRISAGLAMISHLGDKSDVALSYWESTSDAAKCCGWKSGYVEAIIACSVSELRLHESPESIERARTSMNVLRRPYHKTYFIGLGTVWSAIIEDLLVRALPLRSPPANPNHQTSILPGISCNYSESHLDN